VTAPLSTARRWSLPQISWEPRARQSRIVNVGATGGLLLLALALGGIVILLVGGNPWVVYRNMLVAAFGSKWGISDTLVKSTPLILATLGVSLAFRMRLWNIGAEGQLLVGALCTTGVALHAVAPTTPGFLALPLMVLAGFAGGAVWGCIPGWFKAQFGVNEIISSLMLNYVALSLLNFFVFGPWSERGFGQTPMLPRNSWMPRLTDFADMLPIVRGMTVHGGLLLALLAFAVLFVVLRSSKFGFEIALAGDNPEAARYAGVRMQRLTLYVMTLSGGLAGLAGMSEVAGVSHRLLNTLSPGYGFTAIIVAWLARLNPVGALWVSFLFGGLLVGSDEISSAGIAQLLQGIILFVMVSGGLLLQYRIRWRQTAAPAAGTAT